MSEFSLFLKKNKSPRQNAVYAATSSLTDNGKPINWKIKPLTTKESEAIREECTVEVPIVGKPNLFRQKFLTGKYLTKLIVASVIEPNLQNAELQDSYEVKTPEELLQEMVNDPGEYGAFAMFVQDFNHLSNTMQDKVDEAKN